MIDLLPPRPLATLVADPPWPYNDNLPGQGRGAAAHYGLLTLSDIMRFPLPPMAKHSRLFLWATAPFLLPAYKVMEAWGFEDTTQQMVWHKLGRIGMGHGVRVQHEYILIGKRGRPGLLARNVRSVFEAAPTRHSEKPDISYELIERLSPGPLGEIFARRHRPGWWVSGKELPDA